MPFANRQTVQSLSPGFVRIATAFLTACGHGQRQQTRPVCPQIMPSPGTRTPRPAPSAPAQAPPRPRQSRRETATPSTPAGERSREQQTQTERPSTQPSGQPINPAQQEPPPVSQPTSPEPSSPARLPSMLYPVQIDGERNRQGERERGGREGAAPAHLENRRQSHNIEPRPPCAPSALISHLEPMRRRSNTPSTATTPPPFQFCFWRENRTGPQITPNLHGRTAPPAPPRPP